MEFDEFKYISMNSWQDSFPYLFNFQNVKGKLQNHLKHHIKNHKEKIKNYNKVQTANINKV